MEGSRPVVWATSGEGWRVPFARSILVSALLHACIMASLPSGASVQHPAETATIYSVEIVSETASAGLPPPEEEVIEAQQEEAVAKTGPGADVVEAEPAHLPEPIEVPLQDQPEPQPPETAEPPPPERIKPALPAPHQPGITHPVGQAVAATPASPAQDGASNYWNAVRLAIAAKLRYPAAARRHQREGHVALQVCLDVDGRLREVIPVESSAPLFLQAARAAVEAAAPFPSPTNCAPDELSAVIPVRFRLEPGWAGGAGVIEAQRRE